MTIYKGIEIHESLAGLMRHMQGVEDYREVLGKLQGAWDTLTLLGQLTGAAAEMSGTREAFQKLTGDLLNHLGQETRKKAVADLRAKAQNVIDILVRNLFERTADIGFLSADDDVRAYLADSAGSAVALEARFQEYVEKYSVYSDIVLFNSAGRVRARLGKATVGTSQHPLLSEALSTHASYVEYFGEADFLPPGKHLVYAYRVEDGTGAPLGVLALVFRLDDEMTGVFSKLANGGDGIVLACVGADGTVIASSSPIQLPIGTALDATIIHADGDLVRFAGREFLAAACQTHGYQGYSGPGWLGLGLVPVEFAFQRDDAQLLARVEAKVLDAVMQHPSLFSEELRNIPRQAERIQEDLNRSVWNGSVRQVDAGQANNTFAKTLLWEISNTGRKTQAVFEQSIGNLHQTVVAALLQNSVFRAAFAIDVMDRNLYERANDCRWWALNATFRSVLAEGSVGTEAAAKCCEILASINNLYTVYDRLVLFDAQGIVIATSRPDGDSLVGARLNEEWVSRALALNSSQGYVVSHFGQTPLYGGRHTYIYGAAIRHPDGSQVVGGIGVVFDGAPQFEAMLQDAAPRDSSGQACPGAFAAFLGRDGKVIASSSEVFPVGTSFPWSDGDFGASRNTECQASRIVTINGEYFAIGAAKSAGYREYKTSDGYVDDVIAVCGFPLGSATAGAGKKSLAAPKSRTRRVSAVGDAVEIATFYVGHHWLGVPAADVVEAIDAGGVTQTVGGHSDFVVGVKMVRGQPVSIIRLDRLIAGAEEHSSADARQIVLVRTRDKECMGLLVDCLGEIPEVARSDIRTIGNVASRPDVLTVGVVAGLADEGDHHGMLSVIAADRLCMRLGCHCSNPLQGNVADRAA